MFHRKEVMTFEEYVVAANAHYIDVQSRIQSYRIGQAYFNILPEYIANDIRGGELDPFHNDANLGQMLVYLSVIMEGK